jgi:cytochrome c biogenesis protein CcmG/thiol:disulfide interchange protein DsbE
MGSVDAPSRRLRTAWIGRWLAAAACAAAIAAWPGCVSGPKEPVEFARFDFALKDMHGRDVNLADFKGRPVLVNFWATWCAPCKHEIPIFVELVEKYKDQKFTILGISTDDPPEDLRPFAAEYKINYPILVGLGQDALIDAYSAGFVLPTSWFIRPDGSVYLKHEGSGSREWFEDQVKAILTTDGHQE